MAEDNMEISYDDHGDDDIDINIDIDQDNQDEDYMIEDEKSEADTHDDVMVDEDETNASFAMEDDDYMPDHNEDGVEVEIVEVAEIEMTRPTDNHASSHDLIHEPVVDDQVVSVQEPVTAITHEADIFEVESEQNATAAEVPIIKQPDVGETAATAYNTDNSNIPPVLDQPALKEETAQQDHSSQLVSQQILDNQDTEDPATDSISNGAQMADLISVDRDIVVHYNDVEYTMVSSSENDDPNAYFLKDSTVLAKPLSALFTALRDVLGDEVPSRDELCLVIDDLGLETTELVDVHTTLLHNDDNDNTIDMPPFHVSLTFKPEFSKAFSQMIEYAKSGHGHSEIVLQWEADDGTEAWGGSESGFEDNCSGNDEGEYSQHEIQDEAEIKPVAEVADETVEVVAGEVVDGRGAEHDATGVEKDHLREANEAEAENIDAENTTTESQEILAKERGAVEQNSGQDKKPNDTDAENEGDFIDYDDDDFTGSRMGPNVVSRPRITASGSPLDATGDRPSSCRRTSSCFCTTCTKRIADEYEQLNEELDRSHRSSRSSSRATDGINSAETPQERQSDDITELTEKSGVALAGNVEAPSAEKSQTNELGESYHEVKTGDYNQAEAEVHDEAAIEEHHEDDYTNYEELLQETTTADEAVEGDVKDVQPINSEVPESQINEGAANRNEDGDEDEISYDDDETDEPPISNSNKSGVLDSGTQAANVAGNNQAPNEAEVQPLEQPDEIDYDDDDETTPKESEPVATATQTAMAKRPHEEPDTLDGGSPEAKRARA